MAGGGAVEVLLVSRPQLPLPLLRTHPGSSLLLL